MTRHLRHLVALNLIAASPGLLPAQVVINEVCVSNFNGYADNYGEFEDWFELYNPTGAAVDISGWLLDQHSLSISGQPIYDG